MAGLGIELVHQFVAFTVLEYDGFKICEPIRGILEHLAVIIETVQQKRDDNTDSEENLFIAFTHVVASMWRQKYGKILE